MTKGFRHLGKVPGEGVRPDRGRWGYQRIELFDNAKALRVLRILVVPLIVKIFLNDFVDDLVDPVCEASSPSGYRFLFPVFQDQL